jgi:hypothetical protein
MQRIVDAAPTARESDRVQRMISALVTAGIDAGYLVNSRLAKVHWQARDRALPVPAVSDSRHHRAGEPGGQRASFGVLPVASRAARRRQ